MSPTVTATSAPPGLARSRASIRADASIPVTAMPRAASGSATRPVPIPNSNAVPASPANRARTSTAASVARPYAPTLVSSS